MLQPEPDASGQSRKTTAQETAETAYLSEISRQVSTHPESVDLTYKEGVAGSTPASPTFKLPAKAPLLSDAAGQGMAEHELRIRYGGRHRRDLSGTLQAHLLVGDGLEDLPNPEPPSVAGCSFRGQDMVRADSLVGVGDPFRLSKRITILGQFCPDTQ
jgi:hypothetical protein